MTRQLGCKERCVTCELMQLSQTFASSSLEQNTITSHRQSDLSDNRGTNTFPTWTPHFYSTADSSISLRSIHDSTDSLDICGLLSGSAILPQVSLPLHWDTGFFFFFLL